MPSTLLVHELVSQIQAGQIVIRTFMNPKEGQMSASRFPYSPA